MADDKPSTHHLAEAGKPYRWKKGQSGNPTGKRQIKPWKQALDAAIRRRESGSPNALVDLAEQLLRRVSEGDINAIKELADRLDGKVPQAHIGDDESDPITVRNIVTGVVRDGDADD